MQVEAAALQRLGELARVVRREEHERSLLALDRAELGDRHLEVGEHLEQQRFGLDLDAVDLVDQQHDRLVGTDRLEQRPGEQERLGEDVGLDRLPVALVLAVGLDAQQLLLVVPLVDGLRLVEALVALQADEARRRWSRRRPWRARSCRRRPGPRRAPASRAGRRGTRRRRCRRRRGSRRSRRRSRTSGTEAKRSAMSGDGLLCETGSAADLAVAPDDVLVGGELAQAHRAARVQLLRRDADLGAEAELLAVGEARRRVHDHRGRVDLAA